jgi:hypothetical protein
MPAEPTIYDKWKNIGFLAAAGVLAMSLWFAGTAVLPQLSAEWQLTAPQQSWMTMTVQLGFVLGATVSAVLNLSDLLSARRLMAVSALAAAIAWPPGANGIAGWGSASLWERSHWARPCPICSAGSPFSVNRGCRPGERY